MRKRNAPHIHTESEPAMQDDFSLESYDYDLPLENIAQHPATSRDQSKLLVLQNRTKVIEHKKFADISRYFSAGDVLVLNNTKVFPARLLGKKETGGKVEIFLLELPRECASPSSPQSKRTATATALIKSSKRPALQTNIVLSNELNCRIVKYLDNGKVNIELDFPYSKSLEETLSDHGAVPLPPYIERDATKSGEDRQRYQTVYAEKTGAVAAPTAGLHFTRGLLDALADRGVQIVSLTLHVGYGTFAPVRCSDISQHNIHREYLDLPAITAQTVNAARVSGKKIWAVGTTTVRALEYCGKTHGELVEMSGWCDLYITPGFTFKVIDNLITNFHLPKSSLMFLVSALCGRKTLLHCYNEAIAKGYRFYSYGDAMVILS